MQVHGFIESYSSSVASSLRSTATLLQNKSGKLEKYFRTMNEYVNLYVCIFLVEY